MRNHLSRRNFLKAVGLYAAAFAAPGCSAARQTVSGNQPRRPNIIVIMCDDMGFSDIGCYGSEIKTPNLDKLAANGLRFTQFYNTARCCPTRASLLTGLYSHQAGVGHMTSNYEKPGYIGRLNKKCVTIAEALKPAGYRTFVTGKWHVGAKEKAWWPLQRGFDRFYGVPEGGGFYFSPTAGRSIVLDNEVIHTKDGTPVPEGWHSTDAWTDYGIEFVEQAVRKKEPFFWYLAHNAPHWPLQATDEDIAKYKGKYLEGWDKLRAERHKRMIKMGIVKKNWPLTPRDKQAPPWDELDDDEKKKMDLKMAIYAAQIDRVDQNIGKLVAKLKELGIFDDTLILFLADNGGCAEGGKFGFDRRKEKRIGTAESHSSYGLAWANASDTPFRRYKHWVHEGGTATPLIAHWPAVIKQRGKLTHQPGHVIDIMATCCDIAGAAYPERYQGARITPLEGKSLLPIFQGKERAGHDAIFWEHEGNRAVRRGKWKLVSKHPGRWELYDLEADRTELNNLARTNTKKAEELKKLYRAWAKRANVLPWPVKRPKKKQP
ncbi:MAG: sulfatase-like hydrolase/transferase [Planctomycetota bacterium]|jgi:arylsulfatase